MTTDKLETGGSAFPLAVYDPAHDCINYKDGMTTRTYAAIHLGVPQSEHDWINDMIRESQRNELAKAAMQGLLAQSVGTALASKQEDGAEYAYSMADALLAEQEKK